MSRRALSTVLACRSRSRRRAAQSHRIRCAAARRGARAEPVHRVELARLGSGTAGPSLSIGLSLIAAGMLILAGGRRGLPLDYDDSSAGRAWLRVGNEITQRRAVRSALF